MRSFSFLLLAVCAPLFLVACGGDVTSQSSSTSSSGGGGSDSSSSSGGAGGNGGSGGMTMSTSTNQGGTGGSGGAGGSGGTGGSGGSTSEDCAALSVIKLSEPKFADAGGDAQWNPGEGATVFVTMTNTSAADVNYPGITITTDNNLIKPGSASNTFFLIFANDSMPIDVGFTADAAIPKGTSVHFVAQLTDVMNNICVELPPLEFDIVIE